MSKDKKLIEKFDSTFVVNNVSIKKRKVRNRDEYTLTIERGALDPITHIVKRDISDDDIAQVLTSMITRFHYEDYALDHPEASKDEIYQYTLAKLYEE